MEVVSPESAKRDYRFKRCLRLASQSEYAALGINEYWIVDPIKQQVTVLILDEGLYEENFFTLEQKIISATVPELNITPQQIFTTGN